MDCIHSWGPGGGCSNNPEGLICYVPRGERIPRVDLSCDRFIAYHYHHGGIAVIIAWKLQGETYEEVSQWLKERETRDLFKEQVMHSVRQNSSFSDNELEFVKEGVMKAYDILCSRISERAP